MAASSRTGVDKQCNNHPKDEERADEHMQICPRVRDLPKLPEAFP